MHVLGDDQRRHKKGRTSPERFFKRFNFVLLAIQLGCLLVVLSQSFISGGKTFRGSFWAPHSFALGDALEFHTLNCTFNTTMNVEGFRQVPLTLNHANHGRLITSTAGEVRFCIIVYLVTLLVGLANKLGFDSNLFFVRFRHLIIRKGMLTIAEFVLLAFMFQLCSHAEAPSKVVRDYFAHCGAGDITTIFDIVPLAWLYVGLSFVVAGHALTFCLLLYHTLVAESISGVPAIDTPEGQKKYLEEQLARKQQEQQLIEEGAYPPEGYEINPDPGPPSSQTFAPQPYPPTQP